MRAIMFLCNSLPFITQLLDNDFNINFELVSGFLSAIDSFASSVGKDSLEEINMGNNKIIYSKMEVQGDNNLVITIIAFIHKDTNPKKIQENLNVIKKTFFEVYTPQDIVEWDGNIIKFLPFKKIIADIVNQGESYKFSKEKAPVITTQKDITSIESDKILAGLVSYDLKNITLNDSSDMESIISIIFERIKGDLIYTYKPDNNPNPNQLTWNAYIPLMEQNAIAYVYTYRLINSVVKELEHNETPYLMMFIWIIPNKYQMHLSKLTIKIRSKVKQTVDQIYTSLFTKTTDLTAQLGELLKDSTIIRDTVQETKSISIDVLNILHEFNWKNIDQLIYAIMVGKPIAIVTDETNTKNILDFIFMFAVHRSLRIVQFPPDVLDPSTVDVVLIKDYLAKKYSSYVVVELKKQNVKNSQSNKYCHNLYEKVSKMKDSESILDFIKKQINWILSKASLLMDLCWSGNFNPNELRQLKSDLSEDAEKIVLKLMEGKGSKLQNLLDQLVFHIPIQKLILDQNFVKFNEEKILVSSKLSDQQIQAYYDRILKISKLFVGDRFIESLLK